MSFGRASLVLWLGLAAAHAPLAADHLPVVPEDQKLLASDGNALDFFGHAVAVDGDRAVVGRRNGHEPHEDGAAYVFERAETGNWLQVSILTASDTNILSNFASSVAVDGQTIVVGAWKDDDIGEGAGAAYVFERDPLGAWVETAKLVASDGRVEDRLGESVAIDGDTIVAGAEHHDHFGDGRGDGAAYVFERNEAGVWVETAELLASDGEGDALGCTVSISGDRIAAGARGDDDNGSAAGAVYVFERTVDGGWVEVGKLLASDGEEGDILGAPTAIDGDTVVAGAVGDDDHGFGSGAAYVFERQEDGSWVETAKLFSAHPEPRDSFGMVTLDGGTIAVGAYSGEGLPGMSTGTADLFRQDQTGAWVGVARLFPSDPGDFDQFGVAVAIDGATVLVGARLDDDLGEDSGSAYVFSIEDCLLAVELASPVVPAGTPLRVRLRLEHNRPETVTVPFRLWIEDAAGRVVASRTTEPITFRHGDTARRELTLPIPAEAPPGEYRLLVGVERMAQGLAARVERFRVVAPLR